jgi:hypothetical protein
MTAMKMKGGAMTDKQQRAMAAMEAARKEGCSLTQYARAQGLAVRELYDALAALRRRGVLPGSGRKTRSKFVAVRVEQPVVRKPESPGMLCRILHSGGYVIECLQWPPASWMATLNSETADATPLS